MCHVRCEVRPGLIEEETVALITTVAGVKEEVVVSSRSAGRDTILASRIGEEQGRVLIKLPRETASGRWRLWVNADQVRAE